MTENKVLPDINLSRYLGQWVVICKNKIIAHNKDITKIAKEIDSCKMAPTIAKIPEKETLIF